ncbi:aspartyl-phosphate phosphatase Spo0E family protein [Desulfosporosinus sp. BICA1-9]|uniref:aspartyl-phosphate phosphatase Spo0E family protein n=1 Tax=Desulfosporosinus sp. BICA1-9 TaxID=1531958 RepID=UPI00054C4DF4|nr:MAG: hypothetical protein VR66_11020 [Peptococcaceae bacterium BRH_c23]KJS87198.1 MAG: hypothetical protein JL57_14665 [Desulfosporosinus sp. BICA1-9]
METLKELQENIEEVRSLLNNTILVKGSLTDPEIIYISQQLDCLLNKHNRVVNMCKKVINDY